MAVTVSRLQIIRRCAPDFRIETGELKICRHNADHREQLAIERNRLTGNLRIGLKTALPRAIAEDHGVRFGPIVIRRKGSAEHWLNSENIEKTARSKNARHALRGRTRD